MPQNLAARAAVIVHPPQIVAVGHRCEGAVERQNLESMARQLKVPDDLRPEQRNDVGTDRDVKSWEHLFGHGGPAEHMASLEDQDTTSCPREIRGMHEAVVAATNHDGVVGAHI